MDAWTELTCFSPDLNYIAICTKIENGDIRICSTNDDRQKVFPGLEVRKANISILYTCMEWCCNLVNTETINILILGTKKGDIIAIDVDSFKIKWAISECHSKLVQVVSSATNTSWVYSGGRDGKICIICIKTGKQMKSVKAFSTCSVSSLSVSTDGQKVAALSTSSELKTIKFNVRVRRKSFRGTHQRKTRLVKGKLFRLANQRKIYLLYSWRRTLPPILSKAFYQILGTCWAVGLIRQFEALLKKKGKLRDEEFLCIHSLIMKCAQLGIVKSEHKYGLVSYSDVEPVLRDVGANVIGADEEYILGENGLTKTFRIRELNIHVPLSTSATHLKQFEKLMIKDLSQGPLTVDIFAPDSYIMNEPGEIYSPTNGEAADIAKGYKSCVDGSCEYVEHHGLLLSGVHRLYWEFQGSYGTSQGDDGFFYIKRGLKIPTIAAFMRIVFEDDILPQTGNLRADLDLTKIL